MHLQHRPGNRRNSGAPGGPRQGFCAPPDRTPVGGVPSLSAGYGEWTATRVEEAAMSGMDKMKNKAQELSGQGKEKVGDATDNRDLQAEGQKDQTAGSVKQAGEKVKDAFK